MKGDNAPNHKIIPIQSLVEKSKQQQKSHANQTTSTNIRQAGEVPRTISHSHHKGTDYLSSAPIQQQMLQTRTSIKEDKNRAATIKKGFASMNFIPDNDLSLTRNVQINYAYDEHLYPKTERPSKVDIRNPIKEKNLLLENHKKQSISITTPKSMQQDSEELTFMKERFKSIALVRGHSETQKFGSIASDIGYKFDDETWNASKFQRTQNSSREMQPIYKSELIKIKTQLFQKQAYLFQMSQKLQQKQLTIKDLTSKLDVANNCHQSRGTDQNDDQFCLIDGQTKKLNERIRQLEEEVLHYKNEIKKSKESQKDEEDKQEASKRFMALKLKQYEIEDREKSMIIMQLKERQQNIVESNQKITNAQQELLRQKQEQLIQISQTAQFYRQQLQQAIKASQNTIRRQSESETRKIIIQQLSGQMAEVKSNLQQLQIRMREMIENQEQLKKQLESSRHTIQLSKSNHKALEAQIQRLNNVILDKDKALFLVQANNDKLSLRVGQLQEQLRQNKLKLQELYSLCQSKDFQLALMSKTCEDYNKKIYQYHHFSEQMRLQIQGLQKKQILDSNSFTSPKKHQSPSKEAKHDNKQMQLKQVNAKLTKEIERLNIVIRNLNISAYQFYKVNKGLNQLILQHQLHRLNSRFCQQMQTDN